MVTFSQPVGMELEMCYHNTVSVKGMINKMRFSYFIFGYKDYKDNNVKSENQK